MTIEEQLKQEILSKYKSVRAFTTLVGVPYTTLDSVFKRGIQNAGISTMLKVFNALNLDIESIQDGTLRHNVANTPAVSPIDGYAVDESEYRIITAYRKASEADRAIIDNIVDRYVQTQSGEAVG